jgi:hypothetical protein
MILKIGAAHNAGTSILFLAHQPISRHDPMVGGLFRFANVAKPYPELLWDRRLRRLLEG